MVQSFLGLVLELELVLGLVKRLSALKAHGRAVRFEVGTFDEQTNVLYIDSHAVFRLELASANTLY